MKSRQLNWPRVIVHVDMDSFFAAVEQLLHPEWRGKPVIVGADPRGGKGRGVVSTASYEARRYGVHSAMPISQAYKLCPHAIFVLPHGSVYAEYSRKIMRILEEFTPLVQPVSIDEAFLDVTASVHLFGDVETLARKLKERIFQETGLTASVGVAPSKSVAKIASDVQKPDGLVIVPPEKVQEFLNPLPVSKLWGVGQKTGQLLESLGIYTVEQLCNYPLEVLQKKFGQVGEHLYRMARGQDERGISLEEEIKSVSHELTFDTDISDFQVLEDTLLHLAEKVASRLRRYRLRGKTVQLKIRFSDFKTFTRHHTLSHFTQLSEEIFQTGRQLLKEFEGEQKAVRLVGIGVLNLVDEKGSQISLWDLQNERKLQLEKVMDQIQEKFGQDAITHAQTLSLKKGHPSKR